MGLRSEIPDPGVKQAPDPGSGSATLVDGEHKCLFSESDNAYLPEMSQH